MSLIFAGIVIIALAIIGEVKPEQNKTDVSENSLIDE